VSAVPDPLRLELLEAGDRDFEAARAVAVDVVTVTAGAEWTDHNEADPGITLLEAIAWGVADLHYRTRERALGDWPVEVPAAALPAEPHWSGVPLAADPAGLLELADTLAGPGAGAPSVADELATAIAGADSLHAAVTRIAGRPFGAAGHVVHLGWDEALAAVRLLRRPAVLRGALDGAALVADARARTDDDEAAVARLRYEPALAGVWDDELRWLVRRSARQETVATVRALEATVRAAGDVAALLTAGVDAATAAQALALHPCPPGADPETWERTGGETTVWPPHALQARTCEPVTEEDYARRARTAPGVRRAWAVAGVLPGVGWDGRAVADAAARPGAVTLLVEALAVPADPEAFLRDVLRAALGDDPAAEVDDPFLDLRTDLDAPAPRRTLCDEVGAALLDRCPVTLKGTLHAVAGTDRAALIERALARVAALFAAGRPESRAPAAAPFSCPGDIEGPWPRVPQPEGGWNPGEPIRLSELVQRLADDPAVLGIEGLQLSLGGGPWLPDPGITGDVPVPDDCVPELAERQCLQVKLALATECGHG
jgi:hypothetical protein